MGLLEPLLLSEYNFKPYKEIPHNEKLDSINFITPEDDKTTEESKKYLGLHKVSENDEHLLKCHWFVGTRWLVAGEFYVSVVPKIGNLDYFQMYLTCLGCDVTSRHLERTFDFYPEEEFIPLKDKKVDIISPFIVATFLKTVYDLVKRRIKYGFVRETKNLTGKIKGRILVNDTIRRNLARFKPHRTVCDYQIFSIDCFENQILKLALDQASRYLASVGMKNPSILYHWLRYSMTVFEKVSLVTINDRDFQKIHYSSFYKEYKNAHNLARLVLKRFGFDVHQSIEKSLKAVPPFWIDMNELFERYCEALLRKYYPRLIAGYGLVGGKNFSSCVGGLRPDFLLEEKKWILDAKYKEVYKKDNWNWNEKDKETAIEDIKQLYIYASHEGIRSELGLNKSKETVKLIILYPDENKKEGDLKEEIKEIRSLSILCKDFMELYKVSFPIPLIKNTGLYT